MPNVGRAASWRTQGQPSVCVRAHACTSAGLRSHAPVTPTGAQRGLLLLAGLAAAVQRCGQARTPPPPSPTPPYRRAVPTIHRLMVAWHRSVAPHGSAQPSPSGRDHDGRLTLTGFMRLVRHQLRVPKHEVGANLCICAGLLWHRSRLASRRMLCGCDVGHECALAEEVR